MIDDIFNNRPPRFGLVLRCGLVTRTVKSGQLGIKNNMHKFNRYSWLLFVLFVITVFILELKPQSAPMNGLFQSTPLIAIFILWSEVRYQKVKNMLRYDHFIWDFFIVTYSFIIGSLIGLCFQFRITEAMELWPLYLYFMATLGMVFSIIFSLGALLLSPHKSYTFIMCVIILFIIIFYNIYNNLFPNHVDEQLLYIFWGLLLCLHFIVCLIYIVRKKLSNQSLQ